MKNTKSLCVAAGLVAALVLVGASVPVLSSLEHQREHEARELGNMFAFRLLERLNETLGALYLLTASVNPQSGAIAGFDEHAADLVRDFPLLRALELAPGGVISHVYPARGNEAVIGHDLLTDKARNREVHLAISRRQLAIAGPLELKQGGVGVIARYPLYQMSADGRSRFWGLSIAVIDVPSLLRAAGESEFERLGYLYQICGIPAGDAECRLAVGDQSLSAGSSVVSKFGVGHAEWRLMVQARDGWIGSFEYGLVALIAFSGGLLVGWSVHRSIRRRPLASPA